MPSPHDGNQPPSALPPNIVRFHDWHYVCTGSFAWVGPGGDAHLPFHPRAAAVLSFCAA